MKNAGKIVTIIALAALIGFTLSACGNGTTSGGGGQLIITNFSDELTVGYYVSGGAQISDYEMLMFSTSRPTGNTAARRRVPSSGNITLNVYVANMSSMSWTPYTGDATIHATEDIINDGPGIELWEMTTSTGNIGEYYMNISAITFTNGNANINFANVMRHYSHWVD